MSTTIRQAINEFLLTLLEVNAILLKTGPIEVPGEEELRWKRGLAQIGILRDRILRYGKENTGNW